MKWTAKRKYKLLAHYAESTPQERNRLRMEHSLSFEEINAWQRNLETSGLIGLQIKAIKLRKAGVLA
jgi:hypothetical protein